MTKTMQAALITHYKQAVPEIQNVPLPTVRPNDVLVRIVAASINPIDLKTKDGKLRLLLKYQMPLILGSDFSGIVTKVGTNVTRFKVATPFLADHKKTGSEHLQIFLRLINTTLL